MKAMGRWQIFGMGMLTTISNPFWYAWWVTVAARYLTQASGVGAASVAAFFLGHASADYGWNTALSSLVGGGKRWISDGLYRALIGVCGVFLVYVGVMFLLQGIRQF
jgi:threonine/homoserine/homoserine lactone efflux protein